MKKSILAVAVIGALAMSSCSNNGKKVETQEAKEVSINNDADTKSFATISENSKVDWRASHLGGTQPRFGKIQLKSASVLANNNELRNAKVVMDMTSFTVDNFAEGDEQKAKLTSHLQSGDFFNVEKYPEATFELTNIKNIEGDYNSLLTGNLTIMGISKSISFKANVFVSNEEVSIKSEDFAVNRSDWNLTYNAEGTEGVPVDYLIAEDIGFTIDVTIKT